MSTINCEQCGKGCCTCQGCQPVYQNNRWLCPWCAQWERNPQSQQVTAPTQFNITGTGNNSVQVITNYMRRK